VTVVDTTGAGDSFTAGLLDSLIRQGRHSPAELARCTEPELTTALDDAITAASLTCQRPGAEPPTIAEVEALRRPRTQAKPSLAAAASAQGTERILRDNEYMVDVSIYVAVITAAAGIVGAAVPQVATVVRDVRQSERDRRERAAAATRDACVELLRAAGELRTLSESIRDYRGAADGMRARVDEVRSQSEATRLNAASVSLQAAELAEPAYQLAKAGSDLAQDVAQGVDMNSGVLVGELNVSRLVECTDAFRDAAVKYARS
jgi:hypothetical protein